MLLFAPRGAGGSFAAALEQRLRADGLELTVLTELSAVVERLIDRVPAVLAVRPERGGDLLGVRELRARSAVPLLVIMPEPSDEYDRVLAIELGADDVVREPVSATEVAAHVRALRRRSQGLTYPGTLSHESLDVDVAAREIRLHGRALDLTAQEFNLLAYLARHPRRVFTRRELLARAWVSVHEGMGPATVTEHVRRLRRKFDGLGESGERWIATVHSVGYRFDPPGPGDGRPTT